MCVNIRTLYNSQGRRKVFYNGGGWGGGGNYNGWAGTGNVIVVHGICKLQSTSPNIVFLFSSACKKPLVMVFMSRSSLVGLLHKYI